jgi:hypothetical protein
MTELRLAGSTKADEKGHLVFELRKEQMGTPGVPHEFHFVPGPAPGVRGDVEHDEARLVDSSERPFEVFVQFGKEPGSFSPDNLSLDPKSGASLVRAAAGISSVQLQTHLGRMSVILNERNEYAAIKFTCRATSKREVFRVYSETVAPLIDYLSFRHDVPIFVRSLVCKDQKNGVVSGSYVAPFAAVTPADDDWSFELELRHFHALYREGLTSGSVFYQFLCYTKILEGIFRWLLPQLRAKAKALGKEFPRIGIRVDDSPSLEGASRSWIGKGVEQTFNDYLQVEFRNAIAHFAASGAEPLVISSYLTSAAVGNNLFLARHCARKMIVATADAIRAEKNIGATPVTT